MNASAWFSAEESNCPAERKILELKGLELERTVLNMDTVSEPFWNNQKLVWGGRCRGKTCQARREDSSSPAEEENPKTAAQGIPRKRKDFYRKIAYQTFSFFLRRLKKHHYPWALGLSGTVSQSLISCGHFSEGRSAQTTCNSYPIPGWQENPWSK